MPAQALATAQSRALKEHAQQTGVWRHVLIHHALLGNNAALREARYPLGSEDLLCRDVLLLDQDPALFKALQPRLAPETDIWLLHAVMRFLLRHSAFGEALALVEIGLRREEPDTSLANAAAKQLYARGEDKTARGLLEVSVGVAKLQGDLAPWLDGTAPRTPPPIASMTRRPLSFYLPVYNVAEHIAAAIEGILGQSYPIEEILIVDDGTPDNAVEIARQYPVRVVAHGGNRGLASARNTAFQSAETEFLGAIDTDAIPEPDFALKTMLAFDNAVPDVAGVGGRMFEAKTATPADRWRAAHLGQDSGPLRRCPTGLFGACTIHRRQDILDAGGFEEKCRTNAEDWYIVRALEAKGRILEYTPHAAAWHQRTDTDESVLDTMWRWAYWIRHERGEFAPEALLSKGIQGTLDQARYCFLGDRDAGRPDLFGLDLAYAFRGALRDLQHGVECGALAPLQAAAVQHAIVSCRAAAPMFAETIERLTVPLLPERPSAAASLDLLFVAGLQELAAECTRAYEAAS